MEQINVSFQQENCRDASSVNSPYSQVLIGLVTMRPPPPLLRNWLYTTSPQVGTRLARYPCSTIHWEEVMTLSAAAASGLMEASIARVVF